MLRDPESDWDHYAAHLEPPERRPMRLCVACRNYKPADRMVGELRGGFVCDACADSAPLPSAVLHDPLEVAL